MGREREDLEQEVKFVKGVGPYKAALLEKLDVRTVRDLLYFAPRDYQDLRSAVPVRMLEPGEVQAAFVRLENISERLTKAGQPLVRAGVSDPTGYMTIIWFNRPSAVEHLQLDKPFRVIGKVQRVEGRLRMTNPKIEVEGDPDLDGNAPVGLSPVYSLTEGLHMEALRTATRNVLQGYADSVSDPLPPSFRESRKLPPIATALRNLHFPTDFAAAAQARRRLIYDEFFVLQTALALKRHSRRSETGIRLPPSKLIDERIRRLFSFPFTGAQNRAIEEIGADMATGTPMNRLLQGDVGAGKTAVAVYGMLVAIANRCQAVMLAPTELLAQQHFERIDAMLSESKVRRAILTGRLNAAQRAETLRGIADGSIDLIVGTHALLQKSVQYRRLGFVVIDEQHKFGVRQRAELQNRHPVPHLLAMTATPIPRTLSMTWFGDVDHSILDEKPPGRQEPLTYVFPYAERQRAYDFLARQAKQKNPSLVVCPRIESTENTPIQSIERILAELAATAEKDLRVAAVHGRMSDVDQDRVIGDFRNGRLDILLSTIVVEVGLDIPDANIVLIENAERFGLSQLHQIRGRVGRGKVRGVCFLLSDSEEATERLRAFAQTSDGFKIAELDAQWRGTGEVLGSKQHGFLSPKLGDYLKDAQLLELARRDAKEVVERDPQLSAPDWAQLRKLIIEQYAADLHLALA